MLDFILFLDDKVMKFIIGRKLGMSQTFDEEGKVIPVTLIEAGPCEIVQVKTKEKDGYESLQFGFEKKEKKIRKTENKKPFKVLREFKGADLKVGDKIDVSSFEKGEKVKISGISKGKGFQGGVKRWGFSGRNATHGVKHDHRTLGSVGSAYPQRVIKGRKMPGRTGYERITTKNLKVVEIDVKNNLISIKGAVPGRMGTLLEIRG
jgi:large subunit ribosomal protein L3